MIDGRNIHLDAGRARRALGKRTLISTALSQHGYPVLPSISGNGAVLVQGGGALLVSILLYDRGLLTHSCTNISASEQNL